MCRNLFGIGSAVTMLHSAYPAKSQNDCCFTCDLAFNTTFLTAKNFLHLLIFRTSIAKGTKHLMSLRLKDGHPPSYIISASLSGYRVKRKSYWNRPVAYPICWSVCVSVCPEMYCGKTADWIRMPFRVVSGVG